MGTVRALPAAAGTQMREDEAELVHDERLGHEEEEQAQRQEERRRDDQEQLPEEEHEEVEDEAAMRTT